MRKIILLAAIAVIAATAAVWSIVTFANPFLYRHSGVQHRLLGRLAPTAGGDSAM